MDPITSLNIITSPILTTAPILTTSPILTAAPIATCLNCWFCNDKYTPMAQVIVAFAYGVILSPWASGLFILIITIIIYETLLYIFTHGRVPYYNLFVRTGVICASIAGYIIGRTVSGDEILQDGIPKMPEFDW